MSTSTPGRLILLGAGGHAKVVLSLAQSLGWQVTGVCDPILAAQETTVWRGVPVLGGDEALDAMVPDSTRLANGIGQIVAGAGARIRAFETCTARGFVFPALVHPSAVVDGTVSMEDGVQVMAGAVLQADACVGANSIVNTRASVDHDAVIERHVHIAPGATLSGAVRVGERAFVGAGATVAHGLHIGADAFLCAGALLSRNLGIQERWPPRASRVRS